VRSSPIKSRRIKEVLDILFLGDKKSIRSGGNLNPKKVAKRTKIHHKKILTKMSLNKSNVLRVIDIDDHVINIEKEKSPPTRRRVNKQHRIMRARRETTSSHHRGEELKPCTRGMFQTIKRAPKTTNHAIRNRVPWRRLHVNLLTQLSIEKSVLNIQLRHRPVANRGHNKKSVHSGHMGNRGKSLIIITSLLLLRTTSHKTRFVVLRRSIRASLHLVDPLACDGTNTGRRRDKIPGACTLKHNKLLGHDKLPFRMTHSIPIRSRIKSNRETIVTRRITIRWTTMASRKRRWHLIRRKGPIKRRNIGGSIQNLRAMRIMEQKRR
jgi:hypothetical protein